MDRAAVDGARWRELAAPGYAAATLTLCLGVGLFAFNSFLVSTALPSAVGELDGVAVISWAVAIYLLFAILGGVLAPSLKARHGARRALVASGLVFLGGCALSGLADGMATLLVGRALAGIGEGVIAALCYALIPELFPSRLVPKVFGAEAMVWALAAFGGPLVAGILTELLSWRAGFLVNVPLALLFVGLALAVVPAGGGGAPAGKPPILRLAGIGGGVTAVALAAVAPTPAAMAALAALALPLFVLAVVLDRRAEAPLFPTEAFRPRGTVAFGLWFVLLMPVAQASTSVYLVLAAQTVFGLGPGLAGAVNATLAMAWSLSAVAVASLVPKTRDRLVIRVGGALAFAGLVAHVAALAVPSLALAVLAQAVIGAGFGISWGYVSQMVMEAAPGVERDRASALLPTLQSAGYAIGAALAGLVANAAGLVDGADALTVRWSVGTVFAAASLVALLAVGAALAVPDRRPAAAP